MEKNATTYFRLHAMGHTASMNIFLKQEIDRIQVVIQLVRSSLKDLLLAVEGVIIMSEVILRYSPNHVRLSKRRINTGLI